MPFPRKQRRFLDQLVQARFRPQQVRKLLDERQRAAAAKSPSSLWLTGTHGGLFYRIRVPPQRARLPRLPQLHTPTSPPILRFTPVGESGAGGGGATAHMLRTAASSHKSLIAERQQNDFWNSLFQWLRENGPTLVLNFGSICTLIGFTRTDVLELRMLSVTGSLCAVFYHVMLTPFRVPPILWSLTFAGVNSYKIFEILEEREGAVNLTQEQEERYIHFFMPHGVTPKQFEMIQQKAQVLHVKKGTVLIKQNDELKHVYLVVSGSTRASVLGRFLTAVSTTHPKKTTTGGPFDEEGFGGGAHCGAWIGEMSLLERVWLQEQGKQQLKQQQQQQQRTAAATTTTSQPKGNKQPVPSERGNDRTSGDKKASDDDTSKPSQLHRKQSPPQQQSATHVPQNGNQLKASHSMYTIVAAEDCLVLRWSHEDMQALMAKSTDMRAALTRAMTAAVVGKVIQFTVSRSKSGSSITPIASWSNWLQDWKYNAGARVQISTTNRIEEEEDDDNEDPGSHSLPPALRENLPSYPIRRFR